MTQKSELSPDRRGHRLWHYNPRRIWRRQQPVNLRLGRNRKRARRWENSPGAVSAKIDTTQKEGIVIGALFENLIQIDLQRLPHRTHLGGQHEKLIAIYDVVSRGEDFHLELEEIAVQSLKRLCRPFRSVGNLARVRT